MLRYWKSCLCDYRSKYMWSDDCCSNATPDNKVHGANAGPIWGRQDPGGPHVGPMNFTIWDIKPWVAITMWSDSSTVCGILMLKIRGSWDHYMFIMVIPYLKSWVSYWKWIPSGNITENPQNFLLGWHHMSINAYHFNDHSNVCSKAY